MPVVLKWNGEELPNELQTLTAEEDAGLIQALQSLRQGKGVDAETVFARIEGKRQDRWSPVSRPGTSRVR